MDEDSIFGKLVRHYGRLRCLPFGHYFVEHTLRKLLIENGVSGKAGLDLGCGDGECSRLMMTMGASQVVAVDSSLAMITMARHYEALFHQSIQYLLSDITTMQIPFTTFQIVLFVFVLELARNPEELSNMCRAAYNHMAPGGTLIIITIMMPPRPQLGVYDFRRHGILITVTSIRNDRELVGEFNMYLDTNTCIVSPSVPLHIYSRELYEYVLKEVGFEKVVIRPLEVSPDCPESLGAYFWSRLQESEFFYSVVCNKSTEDESVLMKDLEDMNLNH